MADTWVEIKYSGIGGTRKVTLGSFNRLHKRKGWKLVDSKAAKPEAVKKSVKKVKPVGE